MKRILLTGATGFIGSHIAEELSSAGYLVTCLVRPGADISFLKTLPVEFIIGDITNYEQVKAALHNKDAIVHNAAKASDWGNKKDFWQNNVFGTEIILKCCAEMDIRQIVMTGSISVYGEENSKIVKNENSPFNSHYPYFCDKILPSAMNYYRDSKAAAEISATLLAKKYNLNLTILEPVWVFGEREFHTGFYEYMKTVKSGCRWLPGSKKNKFHVVYVKDLAKAYQLAIEKNILGCNRYIIGNPNSTNMAELFTEFCISANIPKPIHLPKWLVYPIAFLLETLYSLLKITTPPLLTRGRVNMFYDNIEFSCQKANQDLGFKTEFDLKEAIDKTVNWYKKNNLL